MKKPSPVLLLVLLMVVSVQARAAWQGSVASDFKVKATVDSFTGKAVSEPVVVPTESDTITVTFAIATMETGKKKRDEEMRHMFHAEEFPLITGSAAAAPLLALQSGDDAELPVTVTMHGVTREVTGTVTAVESAENALSFDLAFPLSLKEFGLKPPSVMGIIRVHDVVQVLSRVTLGKTAPEK